MTETWMSTRRAFLGACLSLPVLVRAEQRAVPALMLANVYRDEIATDLSRFWVSEKLDGVRAYWDGSRLVTRAGNLIAAPGWFTARLPRVPLDGELWGGRKTFERTSGTVRTASPDEDAWRGLKYMVFDTPGERSSFDQRLHRLEDLSTANLDWFAIVPQVRVKDSVYLRAKLREVEALGGEGLMLHRGTSMYVPGRSDDLLKLKSFEDGEAKVIGHAPGQGKYEGMLGALIVERDDGAQFRIGSGLSDLERTTPPPVGSWVTYAFNGLTNSGLPRFPRFVRVWADAADR